MFLKTSICLVWRPQKHPRLKHRMTRYANVACHVSTSYPHHIISMSSCHARSHINFLASPLAHYPLFHLGQSLYHWSQKISISTSQLSLTKDADMAIHVILDILENILCPQQCLRLHHCFLAPICCDWNLAMLSTTSNQNLHFSSFRLINIPMFF